MSLYTIQIIWTMICILGYSYLIYKVGYWTYKKALNDVTQNDFPYYAEIPLSVDESNGTIEWTNVKISNKEEEYDMFTAIERFNKWKLPQTDDDFIDELKMEFDTYEDLTKRNKKGDDK